MLLTEIKRERITAGPDFSPNLELGKEASELLGYSLLERASQGEVKVVGKLRSILVGLEIEVLNRADVEVYKWQEWERATRATFEEWMRDDKDRKENRYSFVWTFHASQWKTDTIGIYDQQIPIHVINKAIQIKRACSDADILVERLENTPDPFLIARLDGESFYVEVWDEPKFENR